MASSPEKNEQNATSCETGGGQAVKCRARVALRLRRDVREKNGLEEKKKKRAGGTPSSSTRLATVSPERRGRCKNEWGAGRGGGEKRCDKAEGGSNRMRGDSEDRRSKLNLPSSLLIEG